MPLIGMKEMLADAYAGGYAVGGFDGFNAETFQAIIETGLEKKSPLLTICAPSEYGLLGAKAAAAVARTMADPYNADLCLHLDHAATMEQVVEAIEAGFSSVMIDGSKKPFEENIALTAAVVKFAHARGVPVEAELGSLTRVDTVTHESADGFRPEHTNPADAAEFVERTGCDFLAVSIGNAHGLYTQAPTLDFARLEQIRDAVPVPLVLHGGSGTPEDQLVKAVGLGIAKVNVASEIAKAFTSSCIDTMTEGKTWWVAAKKKATDQTRLVIARWMDMLGSSGKA
ncbi:MAG: class II fructose-bisphosphate aldolase [Planctomycetaceae bacterium]|nr:class II fructose-bisphosphate aldolase [Planctomycetaceae bacterium]